MIKPLAIHLISHLSKIRSKMTDSCLFCKIVSQDVHATIVYRDEQVTAFRDIHPVGPTHILLVPNKHIESAGTLEAEDEQRIGHLFSVARKLAEQEGISKGYRLTSGLSLSLVLGCPER